MLLKLLEISGVVRSVVVHCREMVLQNLRYSPPAQAPRFTNATILRAMALFGITATIICILVNLAVGTQIWWSLFVAAGLLCIFLSAVVAIIYRRDIIQNIGWQVALVPILSILWDIGTG